MAAAKGMDTVKRSEFSFSLALLRRPALLLIALLFVNELGLAQDALALDSSSTASADLLTYLRSHTAEPIDPTSTSIPRYDRKNQFGAWAHQDVSHHCVDTRGEVLLRDADSSVPVTFKSAADCVVVSGLWHDPYAGNDMTTSTEVQIDHVVPLKNAYYSGAYAWRNARRCHYYNYLQNTYHLLAVSGHENMSKGDKGPDGYIPPLDSFQCEYISDWMKIKMIWDLTATPDEVAAIEDVISQQKCDPSLLKIATRELNNQRALSEQPISECERFEQEGISAISHHPARPETLPTTPAADPAQNK